MENWNKRKGSRLARLKKASAFSSGKIVRQEDIVSLLESVIASGSRVCLEGDNQKQAVFLAESLAGLSPEKVKGIHLLISTVSLPEHLDIFESGIASKIDFSYCGRQAGRMASLITSKKIEIGAIHTYPELYARYFIDLTPDVCLLCAESADKDGNLYFGFNAEDSPVIAEATAFHNGIVIAQVNNIVEKLPRADVPGDWVDFVVQSPRPYAMDALFTRDPAKLDEIKVLMAMMAIKGIYAEYGIQRLNHGVGFNTAAIELLLPTYAAELGLKGKICKHWLLNPHPTLIPAIEAGFVESVFSPGSEIGMGDYIRARSDVFFNGKDGSMRSNRAFAQMAGHYGIDLFIGSTLQIDTYGNSSTATLGRVAGFGGAPNLGCDSRGRRHASGAWLRAGREAGGHDPRGRKLVVQLVETFQQGGQPTFVEKLDAFAVAEDMGQEIPPIMIYGDDLTHIITEEGIASLHLCRSEEEREQAVRGVAGYTPVGLGRSLRDVENLRDRGIIKRPEDLGIKASDATTDLLAARSIKDLVIASGGLYNPPAEFVNW
ncbi:MAG: malonate decarboxylase subunit alpha [Lentisphaerae bacterium GWF2_44_16]|nr:MAG: malonate decarboxylase subunit alpha [Lentisphaerae bacterium GWF2_44_16]